MTFPSRTIAGGAGSINGDDAAEVVPLEEDIDLLEAHTLQEALVLLQPVRDEDVLERLALLRDFDFAVAVALLHLVVVVDEEAVENRMFPQNLLDEDQAAAFVEVAVDPRDESVTIQRPHELERQDHQRNRRVLEAHAVVEVLVPERVAPREARTRQFLLGLPQHLLRRID